MHAIPVALWLFMSINAGSNAIPPSRSDAASRVESDARVMSSFASLLYGAHGNIEVAAFIVDEGEDLACAMWPREGWIRAQAFTGRIPAGTVAIAHTHPPHFEKPSEQDVRTAEHLRMPVYVVTVTSVWVADPGAVPIVREVAGHRWRVGIRTDRSRCTTVVASR